LQAKLGQNSPFLEGVDFFATAKKDGVVSATQGKISLKTHRRSSPNTTLVFSHKLHLCENPPLLQKGNLLPVLLANTTPPTPSSSTANSHRVLEID